MKLRFLNEERFKLSSDMKRFATLANLQCNLDDCNVQSTRC